MNKKNNPNLEAVVAKYTPFLIEIRKRLIFIVLIFLSFSTAGFFYFEKIIKTIISFYNLKGLNIVFTSPFQYLNLAINTGISVGIFFTFPLILYQLVSFLKPALKEKEFKTVISLIPISIFLFLAGFIFGGWLMKFVIALFSKQANNLNLENLWSVEDFLNNIFVMASLMGLIFQFPIVLTGLIRLDVIKYSLLTKNRPNIYIILLLITLFMPATDIFSDMLIFFPLAFLFEITLLLNYKYR